MEEILKSAAEISLNALQHIADGIEDGAKASVKSTADNQVVLEILSGEPATIIGKHGQTIDAIQYLVGVITNKRLQERVRVVVDVEGYRSKREEALTDQARYFASQVKETGEEAVLEPLHANERRIIHSALADDPDVYTYSEGEEPDRHVVISPKK
jgi:spoIIIJ-associated protein